MKEAMFYKKLKNNIVKCELCPNFCVIKEGGVGSCKVRKNIKGKFYSMVYGKPCAVNIDPIEKKPLFHFFPGEKIFSIGTAGCNLHCMFCQNWTSSQVNYEEVRSHELNPEGVVEYAIENDCKMIGYTYNEPTIFYEYVLDTAKIARKKGLKNVLVTNGYINQIPLAELLEWIDAANVDLKSFDDEFYRKICGGKLEPVLESLKLMKKKSIWIEITNLLIDGLNDDEKNIRKLCRWVKKNLNCPIHFSRYFPHYKMQRKETKIETLLKAKRIAEEEGLDKIYIGNV
jgi:pyruvate formate lyase activating enzyme